MRGDSFSGIRTLPLLIGPDETAKVGFVSFTASIFLLLPLVVARQTVWCTVLVILMILSLVLLIQLCPKQLPKLGAPESELFILSSSRFGG